jgi:propionate CoA-transferase
MGVAAVAYEEGLLDRIVLNNELGVIGGLPEGGKNFGPARNPSAFISQTAMFDFYDGGGLDLTCVGLAQRRPRGQRERQQVGPKIIGCGGFIDITQSARTCVFCGEFTAGGLETAIENAAWSSAAKAGCRNSSRRSNRSPSAGESRANATRASSS